MSHPAPSHDENEDISELEGQIEGDEVIELTPSELADFEAGMALRDNTSDPIPDPNSYLDSTQVAGKSITEFSALNTSPLVHTSQRSSTQQEESGIMDTQPGRSDLISKTTDAYTGPSFITPRDPKNEATGRKGKHGFPSPLTNLPGATTTSHQQPRLPADNTPQNLLMKYRDPPPATYRSWDETPPDTPTKMFRTWLTELARRTQEASQMIDEELGRELTRDGDFGLENPKQNSPRAHVYPPGYQPWKTDLEEVDGKKKDGEERRDTFRISDPLQDGREGGKSGEGVLASLKRWFVWDSGQAEVPDVPVQRSSNSLPGLGLPPHIPEVPPQNASPSDQEDNEYKASTSKLRGERDNAIIARDQAQAFLAIVREERKSALDSRGQIAESLRESQQALELARAQRDGFLHNLAQRTSEKDTLAEELARTRDNLAQRTEERNNALRRVQQLEKEKMEAAPPSSTAAEMREDISVLEGMVKHEKSQTSAALLRVALEEMEKEKLQAANEHLTRELHAAQNRAGFLKVANKKLADDQEVLLNEVRNEVAKTKRAKEALETTKKDKDEEISKHKAQKDQADEKNKQLERKITDLGEEVMRLKDELRRVSREKDQYEQDLEDLEKKLREEQERMKTALNRSKKQKENCEKSKQALQARIEELEQKFQEEQEKMKAELEETLDQQWEIGEKLKQDLRSRVDELQRRSERLDSEKDIGEQKLREITNILKDAEMERDEARRKCDKIKADLEELKNERDEYIKALQRRIEESDTTNEAVSERLSSNTRKPNDLILGTSRLDTMAERSNSNDVRLYLPGVVEPASSAAIERGSPRVKSETVASPSPTKGLRSSSQNISADISINKKPKIITTEDGPSIVSPHAGPSGMRSPVHPPRRPSRTPRIPRSTRNPTPTYKTNKTRNPGGSSGQKRKRNVADEGGKLIGEPAKTQQIRGRKSKVKEA